MTINYKGMDKDYNYRVAEISWDDDNKKENILIDRLETFMYKVHGYNMDVFSGYAIIEVSDRNEYKEVVGIYKKAKKMFINCMKYGF